MSRLAHVSSLSNEPMQSYHATMGGGLDSLTRREHPMPAAGPGEVLVRVRAVSLNNRELSIIARGIYPLPVKTPDLVPVSDGAGDVVAIGDGVTRASVGDRVIASIFPTWIDGPFLPDRAAQLGGSLDGMLAEYVVLPEEAVVPIPPHLSYEEAATLPCAALTAWNALTGGQPLRPGDTVLTLGSGGVSLFAIQLAHLAGARVIATTSDDDKAPRLRALGAETVINYRTTPAWDVEVRRLTGGRGVDRVVEVGGGATLERSLKSVAWSGEVAFVGSRADGPALIDANRIFLSVATVRAIAVGSRSQLTAMARAIETHQMRPVIDRVFEFDDARAAFDYYATGRNFGKVIIRVAR